MTANQQAKIEALKAETWQEKKERIASTILAQEFLGSGEPMTVEEICKRLDARIMHELPLKAASQMLRKQQAEIEALKEQLEDCTCQGGHSQAYLKAKGKAQEK